MNQKNQNNETSFFILPSRQPIHDAVGFLLVGVSHMGYCLFFSLPNNVLNVESQHRATIKGDVR